MTGPWARGVQIKKAAMQKTKTRAGTRLIADATVIGFPCLTNSCEKEGTYAIFTVSRRDGGYAATGATAEDNTTMREYACGDSASPTSQGN